MSEELVVLDNGDEIPVEEIAQNGNGEIVRCHPHYNQPNFCNDLAFSFGDFSCRKEDEHLRMAGGSKNCDGYAIPKDSVIHSITATWEKSCSANEELVLQINGKDVEGASITIDKSNDSSKVCLTGLKINTYECDTINIVSRKIKEDDCWVGACEVEVSVFLEMECHRKLKREGDGVIEALDTQGISAIGTSWSVRQLDFVRTNSMPYFAQFSDLNDFVKLRHGVYKIWFGAGLKTKQSTNLVYDVQLQVDKGAGWVDVDYARNTDHDLSGDKGALNATRMITQTIPHGATWNYRIVEKVSADTSIQIAESGASLLIERVANGAM